MFVPWRSFFKHFLLAHLPTQEFSTCTGGPYTTDMSLPWCTRIPAQLSLHPWVSISMAIYSWGASTAAVFYHVVCKLPHLTQGVSLPILLLWGIFTLSVNLLRRVSTSRFSYPRTFLYRAVLYCWRYLPWSLSSCHLSTSGLGLLLVCPYCGVFLPMACFYLGVCLHKRVPPVSLYLTATPPRCFYTTGSFYL